MQIIEKYENIPDECHGAVVVIGNFDGIHKGHKALLNKAKEIAKQKGAAVAVLTFEPHPRSLFRPDEPAFRITPHALKIERLKQAGVEILFSIPFNWDFASQPAADFVEHVLVKGLKPAHVIVGYDFRFGQMRKGDPDIIKASGLSVSVVDKVGDEGDQGGRKYSSSTIRQLLRHGKMSEANDALGWDWEIRGTVEQGDQRGRQIGYPTANFPLGDVIHPAYGIYAAHVNIEGEREWRSAAINIGIRPMFEVSQAQVEAFILDFDRNIYGRELRLRPVQFLRGEAKFDTLDELVAQMDKDCMKARQVLSKARVDD